MSTISTSVGIERISKVVGYGLKKGRFNTDTPYLPQRIAILGEANTANQVGLTTNPVEVTSAAEAGALFGFGSPIHSVMRILRPLSGDGVGGIPTIVYPQISNVGATATTRTFTVVGTVTKNATHTLEINGRDSIDFKPYSFSVVIGETATQVATKIKNLINSVTNAPCTATNTAGVITITSKWKGETSAQLLVNINTGSIGSGVSYSQTASVDGSGTVDLSNTLLSFGDEWNTIVINTYGEGQFDVLEQFNGVPSNTNPTGRYSGLIFKPFISFSGTTLSDKDALTLITDNVARIDQVTNVLCVAPNSKNFKYEVAADLVLSLAPIYQNTPHLDESRILSTDISLPSSGDIGDMKDYNNRDFLIKKGCSTVLKKNGQYQVQDLVTTYHPDGEIPLQYSYPRNLIIDFNVAYKYRLLEELYLTGKTIVADSQLVTVGDCIKPNEWKSLVSNLFDGLAEIGLITDPEFSKQSVVVNISTINPNRFETTFSYKRTGTVRISSTTATVGF